jgi:hypothetical protein
MTIPCQRPVLVCPDRGRTEVGRHLEHDATCLLGRAPVVVAYVPPQPRRAGEVYRLLAYGGAWSALRLREALGHVGYGSVSKALDWLLANGHIEKVLDGGRYRYQRRIG